MKYSRNLKFEEEPDYVYLRSMFENVLTSNGWQLDYRFDWSDIVVCPLSVDGVAPHAARLAFYPVELA